MDALTPSQIEAIRKDWPIWRARHQTPPERDWRTWLILGGRGSGKTRAAAEWIRGEVAGRRAGRIALLAPSFDLGREVMIEGPSGLLAISANHERPAFTASRHRLDWPNGAQARLYSAEDPDSLRGPQHAIAWGDEWAAWPRPQETLDMLRLGLRVGARPRIALSTTPRPLPALKALMADPHTAVTRGRTGDAAFLPEAFRRAVLQAYGGTMLGAQELDGQIVEDRPGALWTHALLEQARGDPPDGLDRVVVAADPPVTSGAGADACGIVVAGASGEGLARRAWVLADESLQGARPDQWAAAVARAYQRWDADRVVAEVNQGGDLVASVLRSAAPSLPIRCVRATRGKAVRAEPVAALYEQRRVTHCGVFTDLEAEMRALGTGDGPDDRVDALVWALTDLMLGSESAPRIRQL